MLGHSGDVPPMSISASGWRGGGILARLQSIEVADPTDEVLAARLRSQCECSVDRFLQRNQVLNTIDRCAASIVARSRKMDATINGLSRCYFAKVRGPSISREKKRASFWATLRSVGPRGAAAVEAGTRFVQIKWYDGPAWDAWDVHGADLAGMERMEKMLCPRLDQGLSALLDDLNQRGLIDSTLVVAVGEFGRTPKINQYGARDHWPQALIFSAGIPGGTILAKDREGGYPRISVHGLILHTICWKMGSHIDLTASNFFIGNRVASNALV
jgi:hypothetical protein